MNISRRIAGFVLAVSIIPTLASALTAQEIQAQIEALLAQISQLQKQVSSAPDTLGVMAKCPNLSRTLTRGSRGQDVVELQYYLITEKTLAADSATGYFGALTEGAVKLWQSENGIVSSGTAATTGYGVVGARTRTAIAAKCRNLTVRSCPMYNMPICASGYHVETAGKDANGCDGAPQCVQDKYKVSSCPTYDACPAGHTVTTSTDANGCNVPQCHAPAASISVTMPQIIDYIDRGFDLPISWQTSNAPAGSEVYLSLTRNDGSSGGGVIKDHLSTSGSYTWKIPLKPTNPVAVTGGDYLINGGGIIDGVIYKLKATLYKPSTAQCYEGCPPDMGVEITSAVAGTIYVQ